MHSLSSAHTLVNIYHITQLPLRPKCWDCNNRGECGCVWHKVYSRFKGQRMYACLCASLIICIYLSLHAQNLKLSWITNCQLCRSVSTIPCFYLTAHCILGVVVCLNGPVCVAACGLHHWDWCSLLNRTLFISVAEPFLSSIGPPGPLNCWHRAPPPLPPLLWAPACGKNCEMCFICILISLAKRSRTSALHWIHNVNKYQLFCLNSTAIL